MWFDDAFGLVRDSSKPVIEQPFNHVRLHAELGDPPCKRAAKIVQGPARDPATLVEPLFVFSPTSIGRCGDSGTCERCGNLVGLTTFLLKGSENLNFAIAAQEYAR
jgi:hypothetical protein